MMNSNNYTEKEPSEHFNGMYFLLGYLVMSGEY